MYQFGFTRRKPEQKLYASTTWHRCSHPQGMTKCRDKCDSGVEYRGSK